jgi:HK97 family phage prohead protease
MTVQTTRRYFAHGGLEIRTDSTSVRVEGYASTFGQGYDMGWYEETVTRGAFKETLKTKPDVRFLVNHDGLPLARTKSGTLALSEDSTGLAVIATLDATDPDVRRLVPKMKRGDLDQMSFAFGIVGEEWSDGNKKRTLNQLSLAGGDVSIVTYPANPNATIALRARQLVDKNGDQLRDTYASIAAGDTNLAPAKAKRMMAYLESVNTTTSARSLDQLTALLSTGQRKGKSKASRHLEDVKLLLLRAHADQ